MNNDELKQTDEKCKQSYEELEHENSVLVGKNIELQRTIDVLLRSLVQIDYERNCNLECSNHYMKLYLQESQRANKLFDELEQLKNDKIN